MLSMTMHSNAPFVPMITVLPEVAGPFLWLKEEDWSFGGVGPCMCDRMGWDESMPLSEGLFREFADWGNEFDDVLRDGGYTDELPEDWDWMAFHARGMHLARWLKDELGDAYQVVYLKAEEDPNCRINERTEILAGGVSLPLLPLRKAFPESMRFCHYIVSGGQTGASRAALDFAIRQASSYDYVAPRGGYGHGGWVVPGRVAEDSPVPLKYQLTEMTEGDDRECASRNVADSDGTLIVNLGELNDEEMATQALSQQMGKPCLVVQLDAAASTETATDVLAWLRDHGIETLNVAGPRESRRPGIHNLTGELLQAVNLASHRG